MGVGITAAYTAGAMLLHDQGECPVADGARLFVLYRADGSPLAIADAVETAAEMAARHGLVFVSVH